MNASGLAANINSTAGHMVRVRFSMRATIPDNVSPALTWWRAEFAMGSRLTLARRWTVAGRLTAVGACTVSGTGAAVVVAAKLALVVSLGGSTNSMYSRLNFAVYGQLITTCVASIGSRTGVVPVSRMTPLATLSVARPMPGSPPAVGPERKETQYLLSCSWGARANAMLARNGWPRLD